MAKGGQGIDPTASCMSPGMPRVMIGYSVMEYIVTPDVTYILMEHDHDHLRHIYTDGRDFPANMADNPQFLAIPSASGSMRMATAATTRSWSRLADSKVRAFTMPPASPCMPTTRPSSMNASINRSRNIPTLLS
jgi:hypothetical protein